MAGVMVAIVHYFPTRQDIEKIVARDFRGAGAGVYGATSGRAARCSTPMGSAAISFHSGQKVFIDGRGDLYERGGVLADYMYITKMKPGALAVLNSYQVRACLLERDEPLSTLLAASPEWKEFIPIN